MPMWIVRVKETLRLTRFAFALGAVCVAFAASAQAGPYLRYWPKPATHAVVTSSSHSYPTAASLPGITGTSQSLLINPGPKYLAGLTITHSQLGETGQQWCSPMGSDVSQAAQIPRPDGPCVPKQPICDPSKPYVGPPVCTTYMADLRAGNIAAEAGKDPGWAIKVVSGGNGVPLELEYINHAAGLPDECQLRENGLIHQWRARSDASAFLTNPNGSPFTLGQFKHVIGTFTVKIDMASYRPSTCGPAKAAHVVADFRVIYPERGKPVNFLQKGNLVGVIVFGDTNYRFRSGFSPDVLYWSDHERRETLHGDKIATLGHGIQALPQAGSSYTRYEIDYKQLFALMTPPPGYTLDDAVIAGFDVYSSTRGGDIDFTVKDVDVTGVN